MCDKSWITSHVGVYLWRKAKDGVASTGFTSQRLEPYAFSPPTADDHRSIDESDIAVVFYAESVLDDWTKGIQNNARFQRRGRLLTRLLRGVTDPWTHSRAYSSATASPSRP